MSPRAGEVLRLAAEQQVEGDGEEPELLRHQQEPDLGTPLVYGRWGVLREAVTGTVES